MLKWEGKHADAASLNGLFTANEVYRHLMPQSPALTQIGQDETHEQKEPCEITIDSSTEAEDLPSVLLPNPNSGSRFPC